MRTLSLMLSLVALGHGSTASAQRTSENAVTAAQDAFGVSVGSERIGIYSSNEVRGFNPVDAGNVRVEGVYIDLQGQLNSSLTQGNTIRVGLSALNYPFPAPTGIVDYSLRGGSGGASISPTVQWGTFGTRNIDVQGHLPILGEDLALSGAFALKRQGEAPGRVNRIFNFGLVTRWNIRDHIRVTPFWGYSRNREDIQPTVFVSGSYLPPDLKDRAFGQRWADRDRIQENVGLLTHVGLNDELTLQAGLFRSRRVVPENYGDLYRNTDRDGVADHIINASPEQRQVSTSGEASLAWRANTGAITHTLHGMVRGRSGKNRYGGSDSVTLGRASVGVFRDLARPDFEFGPQSRDKVEQLSGGLGYDGLLPGLGQLSAGIQKTHYEKTVDLPGAAPLSISNSPWLYNVSAAIFLTDRMSVYAAYTKGMEENGTAPDAAVNRGQPLPSAITSQRELGFRYALNSGFQIAGGVFELQKPYFSLDSDNVFTGLGSLNTRGMELSLAGPVLPGLSLVAGGVLMDPRVEGEAVELGRVGEKAVGQTRDNIRLNANYILPLWPEVSVDTGIIHFGPITASVREDPLTGEQFAVPARTVVDLGARYRFAIGDAPAVLRLQVMNIGNVGGWEPTSSGGLRLENPRRAQIELSADF